MAAGDASAAIPASERAALIALYDSTDGGGWYDRANWRNADDTDFSPPGTECTWHGVRCDGPGDHVIELGLGNNRLAGPITPQISDLSHLTGLRLGGNQLTGPVPPEVGNLTQLTALHLDNNKLSGAIPPQVGNLTQLTSLGLGANQLTGPIPPEIGDLTQLTDLALHSNQLSGAIPPQVGNLTRLTTLALNENQLSGPIPPEIGNLSQLLELHLGSNHLSGPIPAPIGNLGAVYWVELQNNELTGPIPGEIGNVGAHSPLGYLEHLYLDHNQLDGPIPREIGNLHMGCPSGHDSGHLRLDHNRLSGPIPPEIGKLCMGGPMALGAIELDSNLLSGPIPAEIGDIGYLGYLSLANNQLTGRIPPQIGNLAHIYQLRLQANRLGGPIPVTFARLTTLRARQSDLRWNALYTSDPTLRDFLAVVHIVEDWEGTQTVAPTGLAAAAPTLGTVPLSWSPILYEGDTGGYQLWHGTRPGGPYNLFGTTADKRAFAAAVSGLSPGTTYYFVLDTLTEPHANNPNTVVSERSTEVSATTPPGGASWHALTVVSDGPGTVSSSPAGIACGGACSATFAPGTAVSLTAEARAGWMLVGWGGACTGTAPVCDVTMDAARAVTASFGPLAPTSYYAVTPCRVFDSRDAGASGALAAGTDTVIPIAGYCSVPATARAVSLNVTVVLPSAGGHLRLHALDTPRPGTSSLNYAPGQTRANNAVVPLGADGGLIAYVNQPSGTTHIVMDVNGYFQ